MRSISAFPTKRPFFQSWPPRLLWRISPPTRSYGSSPPPNPSLIASIELALAECVNYWVHTYRRYRGFFRTVIKKAIHSEPAWDPVRRMGPLAVEPFIAMLAAKSGKSESKSFYYRASAGFQIAFGVMLNASLHRTVLLNLDSNELVDWATEILRHCLFDKLSPALLKQGAGLRPSKGYARPKSPARRSRNTLTRPGT